MCSLPVSSGCAAAANGSWCAPIAMRWPPRRVGRRWSRHEFVVCFVVVGFDRPDHGPGYYVHLFGFDVSLAADPATSYQGTHGDTSYDFFETADLPLFGPLRTLGVPESLIDVVEPFFRVIVELGYDRSIPPWEPTPARLIPMHDPATVTQAQHPASDPGHRNLRRGVLRCGQRNRVDGFWHRRERRGCIHQVRGSYR